MHVLSKIWTPIFFFKFHLIKIPAKRNLNAGHFFLLQATLHTITGQSEDWHVRVSRPACKRSKLAYEILKIGLWGDPISPLYIQAKFIENRTSPGRLRIYGALAPIYVQCHDIALI